MAKLDLLRISRESLYRPGAGKTENRGTGGYVVIYKLKERSLNIILRY